MFRQAVKEDLPALYTAFKKYLKTGDQSVTARFTKDEDLMDYLNFNLTNPQCLILVWPHENGIKKIVGFMVLFAMKTPFLNVKDRIWLEVVWKDKSFKMIGFFKMAKKVILDLAVSFGAGTVEGLIASDRPDLKRFYRMFGCTPRGEIVSFDVSQVIIKTQAKDVSVIGTKN